MIQWTLDAELIPLLHIDGNSNLADLLTKPMELEVENVSVGSDWQGDFYWMKVDTNLMPVRRYNQLTTDKAIKCEVHRECFDETFQLSEIFKSHKVILESQAGYVATGRQVIELLVDPIRFGRHKAIRIINCILMFMSKLLFRCNQRKDAASHGAPRFKILLPNHGKQVL